MMTRGDSLAKVYASNVMNTFRDYVKAYHTMSLDEFFAAGDAKDPIVKRMVDVSRRYRRGQKLLSTEIPDAFFANPHHRIKTLPSAFYANGFVVLSEASVQIMQQFDLGSTSFHEVKFLQNDRREPVEGRYFVLNFGEHKDTLRVDLSSGMGSAYNVADVTRYQPPMKVVDGSIKLSRDALRGCDLWFEQHLDSTFFVSERLRNALKAAKQHVRFRFFECGLMDPSLISENASAHVAPVNISRLFETMFKRQ
jgi:hypothetical protein